MATPPNDDTRMLFKLLADGRWHSYDEIRDRLAQAVPPGRALRKYQERIEASRRQKNDPGYDTDASEDARIFYGARACAQIVITSWKGRGLDDSGTRETRQIRMRPGFSAWGVDVTGPDPEGEPVDEQCDEAPQAPPEQAAEPVAEPVVGQVPVGPGLPVQPHPEARKPQVAKPSPFPAKLAASSPSVKPTVECDECSQVVVNIKNHRRWHRKERLEPKDRPEMALFAESEIRSLVRGIVIEELDKFQAGMQAWLANQFVQVEAAIRTVGRPLTSWSKPQK